MSVVICSVRAVWEVEYTDEFAAWWGTLSEREQETIVASVEVLEERGLRLGRPFVDTIATSSHSNMKELRPMGGHLRILFAFDPRRVAILLLGGDKTDQWDDWYRQMVPTADALFDTHLNDIAGQDAP